MTSPQHHLTTPPPLHNTTSPHHHLTTPPRIVSREGNTSSPVVPPGLVTLILPSFSTKAISNLLTFLATGVVMVDRPLLKEVVELSQPKGGDEEGGGGGGQGGGEEGGGEEGGLEERGVEESPDLH